MKLSVETKKVTKHVTTGANEERLLTVDDVARLLNIRKSSVYAMTSARRLPYLKIGNLVRFSIPDIETWLQSRRHQSVDDAKRKKNSILRAIKKPAHRSDRITKLIDDAKKEVLQEALNEELY